MVRINVGKDLNLFDIPLEKLQEYDLLLLVLDDGTANKIIIDSLDSDALITIFKIIKGFPIENIIRFDQRLTNLVMTCEKLMSIKIISLILNFIVSNAGLNVIRLTDDFSGIIYLINSDLVSLDDCRKIIHTNYKFLANKHKVITVPDQKFTMTRFDNLFFEYAKKLREIDDKKALISETLPQLAKLAIAATIPLIPNKFIDYAVTLTAMYSKFYGIDMPAKENDENSDDDTDINKELQKLSA